MHIDEPRKKKKEYHIRFSDHVEMFGAFTFQTYLVFWPLNFHSKFQMLFLYWCYLSKKHEMETAFLPV